MEELGKSQLWQLKMAFKYFFVQDITIAASGVTATVGLIALLCSGSAWMGLGILFYLFLMIRGMLIGRCYVEQVIRGWMSIDKPALISEMIEMLENHTEYMYEISLGHTLGGEE